MNPRLLRFLAVLLLTASLPLLSQGAPVHFQGEEVLRIQERVGSFTPEARAAAISQRLEALAATPFTPWGQVELVAGEASTDLVIRGTLVMTVTEADARAAGKPRAGLAEAHAQRLLAVYQRHTLEARMKALGVSALLTLISTLGVGLLFLLIGRLFRQLRARLDQLSGGAFRALTFQRLEVLSASQVQKLVQGVLRGLQGLLGLVVGYLYLSVVFSFFSMTKGLAGRLLNVLWAPITSLGQQVLAYLPNLFYLLVIALLTRGLLLLLHKLAQGITTGSLHFRDFHPEWAQPTYNLARILVLAFALVLAFPYLPGAQSEAFKGVSLFVGVLFSIGSSGAVGNMVAGMLMTYMRPFKVGDRIQIGETVGDVTERSALITRIRTIKNVEVTIPNTTVLGSQILNYSANAQASGLILHTTVTIGYDAPWRTVHDLLIEAALATEGILAEPRPFVFQTSLDDFYVSYQINATTADAQRMATIYSDLHVQIQDAFNRGGVEIMSPHYGARRDGNRAALPEAHLPPGYVAPAFRIQQVPPAAEG